MTNIINNLTSEQLAEIVNKIFKVKGKISTEDSSFGFAQVRFNVTSLSAYKIRKLNEAIYGMTNNLFPECETMISPVFCSDNPTILVHLWVMPKD